MDDRQRQIRESAGLEEGRLNQDFIDWLRKWSTPILVVVAIGAVAYWGYERWERSKVAEVNQAFQEFEQAGSSENPSPESLMRVAEEFDGVRSVAPMARLQAADAYLQAVRVGVKPGSALNPDGTLAAPEDALTPEDRTRYLDEAAGLYQRVADSTGSNPAKALLTLEATYGLAAVAESREAYDEAQRHYERIIELADRAQFPTHAQIARDRIAALPSLAQLPTLYALSDLPPLPQPVQPQMPTLQPLEGPPPGVVIPEAGTTFGPELPPLDPVPETPDAPPGEEAPAPAPGDEPAPPAPAEPAPVPPAPPEAPKPQEPAAPKR